VVHSVVSENRYAKKPACTFHLPLLTICSGVFMNLNQINVNSECHDLRRAGSYEVLDYIRQAAD